MRLLVGGACIRVAKEAGCKPVWATAHAQVRVLPLPPSEDIEGYRGPEALTAKHPALNRASGVRVPAGPRDPGSANGRPLRSERSCPGSSPGPGTAPIGDRLMAGRQALALLVEVRVLVPEQIRLATSALFENRIVDDARGRAPPRPRQRPRSRSGDGAWLKSRRCWFDSRREHS